MEQPTPRKRGRPSGAKVQRKRHTKSRRIRNKSKRVVCNPISARFAAKRNVLDNLEEHTCGAMSHQCQKCHALHFIAEKTGGHFTACCQNGKVALDHLRRFKPAPAFMQEWLLGATFEGKNFRRNIRQFNNALAFASISAQIKDPPGSVPYAFRVHGQIYHCISDVTAASNEASKYSQLYILDAEQAHSERLNCTPNQECDPTIMRKLMTFLSQHNAFARLYENMRQRLIREEERARAEGIPMPELKMVFLKVQGQDVRRYNEPLENEIAIIFDDHDGEPPDRVDFVVSSRNSGKLHYLPQTSAYVDPLVYPLIHLYGEHGWTPGLLHARLTKIRNELTLLQFFAYRLAVRPQFTILHACGKLLQQFIVDAYVRIEGYRLKWIRNNQTTLRMESYTVLADYIKTQTTTSNLRPGRMIILPSTFTGSARNLQQNYQDAMSIVRKYGKPDFFITMTCNPRWPDIIQCLAANQNPEDRPDIIARVFSIKLKARLRDIQHKQILGRYVAGLHVIEFQKRGLPHAHILMMVADDDKLRETEHIDNAVCAELPDKVTHPRLFSIVTKHMLHGPCGAKNPTARCMVDGICTKGFPKAFSQHTLSNVNGYPVYQRRDNGVTVQKGKNEVNNQWVVPYNKYLLLKYNAHINVEVCATIKSIKYLFKYVYKGHDCATVKLTQATHTGEVHWDEVKAYLSGRYVSAPEAMWRILQFPMHEQSHTIYRLAIHDENSQNIVFVSGEESEAVERSESRQTTLTAWFHLNQHNEYARQFLYSEIPNHFVFGNNKWRRRKKGGQMIIGRMYTVSPSDQDRFHMRLLLLNVRGATSFASLRTVGGVLHKSYKTAATALNLLLDDNEWYKCLDEASLTATPQQLRQLFTTICVFCNPSDPKKIFHHFLPHLYEDFARHNSDGISLQLCLAEIENYFKTHNKTCADFHLPLAPLTHTDYEIFDPETEKQQRETLLPTLNKEQRAIFDTIVDASVDKSKPNMYFLNGAGGTGKTYLYSVLLHHFRSTNQVAIAVASTGIAATLLAGGRTVHSAFKLPVPLNSSSVSSMRTNSVDAAYIRSAKLIIWDEAPAAHKDVLLCLDRLLKDICNNDRPLGGKLVLLGGDFRQILPVTVRGTRTELVSSSIKFWHQWSHVQTLKLETNMRADATEQEFASWLLKLGDGALQVHTDVGLYSISLPDSCIIKTDIAQHVFGDVINSFTEELIGKTILSPKNEDCHMLNLAALRKLNSASRFYLSIDNVDSDHEDDALTYPTEFLHSLDPSGMAPHVLELRAGAIIILLRNLDARRGLCNGTRIVVQELHDNVIVGEVISGQVRGSKVFIPRIDLLSTDTVLPFRLRRRQFPVKLGFAMTINKSQGQTFESVGIYLPRPVFTHGQLYVAFSRVKRLSSVKVFLQQTSSQGTLPGKIGHYTDNIVFDEILQR